MAAQKSVMIFYMNRWLDRIKRWCVGSLVKFGEEFIKNKMSHGSHLKKIDIGVFVRAFLVMV